MTWDVATARTLQGVGATPSDAIVQMALDTVLAYVENKLGRGLLRARERHTFYYPSTRRIWLHRYPIHQVYSPDCAVVHHRAGWVECGCGGGNQITIDYEGGYDPLPSDLEQALWEAFQTYWGGIDPATGMPVAGGGATVVQGTGDISRVSLPGGGAVTWDVGATVAGGNEATGVAASRAYWGWLAPWADVLALYRSGAAAPGLAIG